MSHIPYSDIAKQYGAPVYIYDAHRIASQFDRLKSAFTSVKNLKLHYAVKANSNLSILRLIHGLGDDEILLAYMEACKHMKPANLFAKDFARIIEEKHGIVWKHKVRGYDPINAEELE